MASGKERIDPSRPDSDHAFQQAFLTCLQAISDPSIRNKANEDLKDLLRYRVDSSIRINLAISLISKAIDNSQKGYSKPEMIRSLGVLPEIFQDKLIEFIPKILQISLNSLTEDDLNLHEPLRDLFGKITDYTLSKTSRQEGNRELKNILKSLWGMCSGTSKYTQIGAALCMSKVLKGVSGEMIHDFVDRISLKLVELLRKSDCKATLQLLECIMSFVMSLDASAIPLESQMKILLLPVVENITNPELNVRKLALEILYYLCAMNKVTFDPYKKELLEIVNQCKYDKAKGVQDMAAKTLNLLNNMKDVPQKRLSSLQREFDQPRDPYDIKESTSQTSRFNQTQKELDKKRPGILKDSSFLNNYVGKSERNSDRQNVSSSKEKITPIVPFSTRNQQNLAPESSLVKFYSPNGISQTQFAFGSRTNEPLQAENPLAESEYITRPEKTYQEKDDSRKSYNPSRTVDRPLTVGGQGRASQENFFKNPRGEPSAENVSTRQFTGEGEKEGLRLSNVSSPVIQNDISKGELIEIIAQLRRVNEKQSKVIDKMERLQTSTQDELVSLKTRMGELEDVVKKLYAQQKEPHSSARSSAIYNTSYLAPFQPNSRTSERYADNGRGTSTSKDVNSTTKKVASPVHALLKGEVWEENRLSTRGLAQKKEEISLKMNAIKRKRPLFWLRLDELLKKKNYSEAYENCLEDGTEEALLCLMNDTGPIVDKLQGNLCDTLLQRVQTRLFDEDGRFILLEWIEKALYSRAPLSKQTLLALQKTFKQLIEYQKDSQEKERILKMLEYTNIVLEKSRGVEERKDTDRKKLGTTTKIAN